MGTSPILEQTLEARTTGLVEGFTVRRILPSTPRRMVGPFIFFDHMGPWKQREFPPVPGDDEEFVPLPERWGTIR
jgi:redox-sensitive bicupin YhaK (pirin superfamily)